jgi:hypothetical protein
MFHEAQSGSISGVGGPGGIGKKPDGGSLAKEMGIIGVPGGLGGKLGERGGKMKDQLSGIKGSSHQAQGVQPIDGGHLSPAQKKELGSIKGSSHQAQGVQSQVGATPQQTQLMRKAIGDATNTPGKEVGRDPKDIGGSLSKEQRQEIKDMSIQGRSDKQSDLKEAKHMFDFAKPSGAQHVVFPPDKIVGHPPKPPKN